MSPYNGTTTLLYRSNRILGCLGDAELDRGLRLDLDGFAGLWVATDPSCTLCLYQLSDAWNGEFTILFGLLNGSLRHALTIIKAGQDLKYVPKVKTNGEKINYRKRERKTEAVEMTA